MKNFKTTISILALFFMLIPLSSFALVGKIEQKGIHETSAGIENSEIKEINQGAGQGSEINNITSLQNQGENQQNQVELQQNSQIGQEENDENTQDNQIQGQKKGNGQNQASDKATQRRSRVANAVQEMLQVADRNEGIGQQIRVIAQTQNQNQEQIEVEMKQVKNRGQIKKFFFGPDYKNLNSIEDRLASHTGKIEQLKELVSQITDENDVEKIQEQIMVMEQIKIELEKEAEEESKGFSLFGWLNKMFLK